MAIKRRFNAVSQFRMDIPHVRSIESAVSNDFDELLRGLVSGANKEFVVRGFEINMTGSVGASASGLQMLVSEASILHGTSRESGTFFVVPSGTVPELLNSSLNTKVRGAFVPNAVNYIGIEYERIVDDTTADTVYTWNPTTKNEVSKVIPLAKILNYTIVITTSIWASNVVPIAKITTDVANNVVDVTDDRPMLFRLGSAGRSTPDPTYVYPWTNHTEGRSENLPTSTSSSINPFRGGDKQIFSLKEWMDSVMSSFKELKGTTYWYSQNAGGSLVKLREDLANTVVTGRGNISHSDSIAGRINWSQDIYVKLVTSRLAYRIMANAVSTDITLSDDQVAYINLIRGANIVPNLVFTNASAIVASVGAVSWTGSLQAGDYIKLASDDDTKYYQILSVDSLAQVTLTVNFSGTSTGASGAKAQYAYGVYETNPAPSTDRHVKVATRNLVPFTEDIFWFLMRSDNGGAIPRIYVRFIGSELEQGEDREISDNTTQELIDYIGSDGEADDYPDYSNKLGVPQFEITDITLPAAASITTGQYFLINSGENANTYYVWFNKDAGGGNPAPPTFTPIEVAIVTGNTAAQVATATQLAIDALSDFGASVLSNVVTVTNTAVGSSVDAANFNVGGAFSITVTQQGSGAANVFISDGDNLTLAIKKLDAALSAVSVDPTTYEEPLELVVAAPADDNEVTGPLIANSIVTLPYDSRDSNSIRTYKVGKGDLEVFLNGQKLDVIDDWLEIGAVDSDSNTIQVIQALVVGDVLTFRIDPGKAIGSSGGGGSGEANNGTNVGTGSSVFKDKVGVNLRFRRINAGAGVVVTQNTDDITIAASGAVALSNITSVVANYVATTANDIVLATNGGFDLTVTLPTAVGNGGKIFYIKKLDSGNNLFVASVLNQQIDGVDATATPIAITVQWETISIASSGAHWYIL